MVVTEAFQEMLSVTGKILRTTNYSIALSTQKVGERMMFGPLKIRAISMQYAKIKLERHLLC